MTYIVVKTSKGAIFTTRFIRDIEVTATSTESDARMNINHIHSLLGHRDDASMRLSVKELGWVITHSKTKPCEHCACSKAKQKNVSKEVYLDLSKVTVPHADGTESEIKRKNLEIIVDEATGKKVQLS